MRCRRRVHPLQPHYRMSLQRSLQLQQHFLTTIAATAKSPSLNCISVLIARSLVAVCVPSCRVFASYRACVCMTRRGVRSCSAQGEAETQPLQEKENCIGLRAHSVHIHISISIYCSPEIESVRFTVQVLIYFCQNFVVLTILLEVFDTSK